MMPLSNWVITAGVRLHGWTRAIPTAIQASPATTTNANSVSATPLDARDDLPVAASTAASTPATARAAASAACTPAASRSVAGRLTAAPCGERIPIVSHPFGHR